MIGYGELIVILLIVLVLFGGKKLPELAKNLGKGIREFKKATQGLDDEIEATIIHPKDEILNNQPSCSKDSCSSAKIKPCEEHELH